jgi:two-component system sensor histidine kinase PrrB|tara:strand:- start:4129 stop:4764 length:636 start_codon:yes stop_codon:yes gene_type:complete
MKMNLELLERHEEIPATEKRNILNEVIVQQDRLFSTLESLRLLARGDLSEISVFEEVDLAPLVNELSARQISNHGGGDIDIQFPDPPPLIFGWREGLTVLFNNLLENAYVHSNVSPEQLEILINVSVEEKWVRLTVDDNGIGVKKHERKIVLDRFKRGSDSYGQGSGLGLSLVTQQVEIHSGTIEITESSMGGARVEIALPIIMDPESDQI